MKSKILTLALSIMFIFSMVGGSVFAAFVPEMEKGTVVSLEQVWEGNPDFVRGGKFKLTQTRGAFDPETGDFDAADPNFTFEFTRDPDAETDKQTVTLTSLGVTLTEDIDAFYHKGEVIYESGKFYLPRGHYKIEQIEAAEGYTNGLIVEETPDGGGEPTLVEKAIEFAVPYYADENATSYQESLDIRVKVEPLLGKIVVNKTTDDSTISLDGTTFVLVSDRIASVNNIPMFERVKTAMEAGPRETPNADDAKLVPYFEATHFDTATGVLKAEYMKEVSLTGGQTSIEFEDLPVGRYVLYETKAADGTLMGIGNTKETGVIIDLVLNATKDAVEVVTQDINNPSVGEEPKKEIKAEDIDENGLLLNDTYNYVITVPLGSELKNYTVITVQDTLPESIEAVQPLEWESSHKALFDATVAGQDVTFKLKDAADLSAETAKEVNFTFKVKIKDASYFNTKISNKAKVTRGTPSQTLETETPEVHTLYPKAHLDLHKIDGDKTTDMDGVQFSLYVWDETLNEGAGDWALVENGTKITADGGKAKWENLEPRDKKYRLIEDSTLEGYRLLSAPIDIVFKTPTSVETQEAQAVTVAKEIKNYEEGEFTPDMPNTGTLGALGFAGAGLGALIIVALRRKKEKDKENI